MPGYTEAAKHTMLAALVGKATPDNTVTHLSIHTADPGSTGANEVAGGDPAYARVAVTESDFDAPAGGECHLNNDKEFNGPANEDATHYGIWDGTDFLGGGANTGDLTFNAEGVLLLKAGTKLDLNA